MATPKSKKKNDSRLYKFISSKPVVIAVFALLFGAIGTYLLHISLAAVPAVEYYVDCSAGNDSNSGIGPNLAWSSLNRASKATLNPGDHLLLKSGCKWSGQTLVANWTGSEGARIYVRPYGIGANPIIHNGATFDVKVTGSYISFENLTLTHDDPSTTVAYSSTCNQPIATTYLFAFYGSHNVLRYSDISGGMAGVWFSASSTYNRARANKIHDNKIMQNAKGDLGAWGILINGDSNDIVSNEIYNNVAKCSIGNDGIYGSNSVELYRGKNNTIHHNYAHDDRVFSELGSQSTDIASGNTFSYNLFVSNMKNSRFINTRGVAAFGPVNNTTVEHNTVYVRGVDSEGIICSSCSPTILKLINNIIWADGKAVYVGGTGGMSESGNIFYSSNGAPVLQNFTPKPGSVANPKFVDAAAGDFRLQAGSPAIDKSSTSGLFNYDKAGKIVPVPNGYDSGAFEYGP